MIHALVEITIRRASFVNETCLPTLQVKRVGAFPCGCCRCDVDDLLTFTDLPVAVDTPIGYSKAHTVRTSSPKAFSSGVRSSGRRSNRFCWHISTRALTSK